ncbi:MAG: tannase/feruloyl esterase family alpha/beta hydrolase [Pseudohongiellaceae bacterium]
MENWVENGIAPGAINADQKSSSGVTLLEKIVCPYPQQIKYNAGDNTLRSSYFCE